MIRHYRMDGKPKRTLCGLRIALDHGERTRPVYGPDGKAVGRRHEDTTDKMPALLGRHRSWVPVPESGARPLQELERDAHTHDCPYCLAEARTKLAPRMLPEREPLSTYERDRMMEDAYQRSHRTATRGED